MENQRGHGMDREPLPTGEAVKLTRKRKILLGAFAFIVGILWVACNHLEWRGGGIPKMVWRPSAPDIDKLRKQRADDSKVVPAKISKEDANATKISPVGFRGTNGDGVYKNESILTDWPKEGPPVLWRKLIGGGHSSFAIAGNLAFTIEQQENNEVVVAFSTQTGRVIQPSLRNTLEGLVRAARLLGMKADYTPLEPKAICIVWMQTRVNLSGQKTS